jgi:hypothetical protein
MEFLAMYVKHNFCIHLPLFSMFSPMALHNGIFLTVVTVEVTNIAREEGMCENRYC